ncbi:MAG: MFS transporter [SAR116 cluster bacterium]|nr:MFS transporter [Paracoccaceae bacterium]RCL79250.1 MAG: MFS transporter [SAR116 cluster bacterium]|tara:strand:+ start:4118 stop:5296 length:1179 start_codon:yes stop_codon:yes gene_type:complete
MIAVGCLVALTSFGLRMAFGVFLGPITIDFGWQRETLALALAIQNIFWGLAQPVAGALCDRYGPRPVVVVGALLFALGILAIPYSTDPLIMYLTMGVMVGIGIGATSFAIIIAALTKVVPGEKRSMVMGLVTASGSLGQMVLVPSVQAYIDATSWPDAMLAMAVTAALVCVVASVLKVPASAPAAEKHVDVLETLRCASRTPSYLLLTTGFFVCGFQVAFIGVHFPAFIVDSGLDPLIGATALACIGLFNIIGSYAAGLWGNKNSKVVGLSFIYFARTIVTLVFVSLPITELSVLIFASVIGLLWFSTVPLTSGLVANFFGVRHMGMLFGVVFLSHQFGSFLGVWLGGILYDITGSYNIVWWISIVLGLIAGMIHLPIKDRSYEGMMDQKSA